MKVVSLYREKKKKWQCFYKPPFLSFNDFKFNVSLFKKCKFIIEKQKKKNQKTTLKYFDSITARLVLKIQHLDENQKWYECKPLSP